MEKTIAEASVHEAVGDGVAAAAAVRQQVAETNGLVTDSLVDELWPEQGKGVDDVEGSPADEELQDDHEQHLDYSLLVRQTSLVVCLPQT